MAGRLNVDDMQAVQEVLARYNWAFDAGNGEEWAALFTPDGSLTGGAKPAHGTAELIAAVTGSFQHFSGGIRHHLTDLVAEYAGDRNTVHAKGCNLVTNWQDGGKLFGLALADLVLVRRDGEWKIKSNQLTLKLA